MLFNKKFALLTACLTAFVLTGCGEPSESECKEVINASIKNYLKDTDGHAYIKMPGVKVKGSEDFFLAFNSFDYKEEIELANKLNEKGVFSKMEETNKGWTITPSDELKKHFEQMHVSTLSLFGGGTPPEQYAIDAGELEVDKITSIKLDEEASTDQRTLYKVEFTRKLSDKPDFIDQEFLFAYKPFSNPYDIKINEIWLQKKEGKWKVNYYTGGGSMSLIKLEKNYKK